MEYIDLMKIGGFRLGHAELPDAVTGCTVALFDRLTPAGVAVMGGGPASRDTQILNPLMAAEGIHAILLSGGSAYGLDAAGGVMRYLEARGVGLPVGDVVVPLVCQSSIFDLGIGRSDVRPDAALAEKACRAASYDAPTRGRVGVGIGCTAGKVLGMDRCARTGLGSCAVRSGPLMVGALAAVNALGDIFDGDRLVAGVRAPDGRTTEEIMMDLPVSFTGSNTTLGIVFTNAALGKTQLCKAAAMAHDGYARAIRPVHTSMDGDSVYAVSVGNVPANPDQVGILAAHVMERAIIDAARP